MAGFLYYLPRFERQPTVRQLGELGLGHAFEEGRTPTCRQVQNRTPDGSSGMLVADERRCFGKPIMMDLRSQTWFQVADHFVGYWNDAKPGPNDLAKDEQITGYLLRMADGNKWHIPIARLLDEETGTAKPALPHLLKLDVAGQIVPGPVVERWRYLWDATEVPWQAMLDRGELSNQEVIDVAGLVLGANYAIDGREAFALGLYSTKLGPKDVVALSMDYFTFAKWWDEQDAQKKTAQRTMGDDLTSSPGEKDACQTIAQPART